MRGHSWHQCREVVKCFSAGLGRAVYRRKVLLPAVKEGQRQQQGAKENRNNATAGISVLSGDNESAVQALKRYCRDTMHKIGQSTNNTVRHKATRK